MTKQAILELLFNYHPSDENEERYRDAILRFLQGTDQFMGRKNKQGHLTGSAWIVNQQRTKALLTHHLVLDMWVQLGGHTEEGEHIIDAAFREACEESGLSSLRLISDQIFDIDVHEIPTRGELPAHYHYDIRFLLEADDSENVKISSESKDLKWMVMDQISELTYEESVLRMVRKSRRR